MTKDESNWAQTRATESVQMQGSVLAEAEALLMKRFHELSLRDLRERVLRDSRSLAELARVRSPRHTGKHRGKQGHDVRRDDCRR